MKVKRSTGKRKAFTLVEVLAVIPAVAVILGTVTLTLCALYKMDHQIRDSLDDQRQIHRFATQLRLDARNALSAATQNSSDPDVATPELVLTLQDGSSVRYRAFPNRIDRMAYDQETLKHRESYQVVRQGESPWSIDRNRPFPLITIDLQRPVRSTASDHVVPSTIQLNAALRIVRHETVPEN